MRADTRRKTTLKYHLGRLDKAESLEVSPQDPFSPPGGLPLTHKSVAG